MATHDPQQWDSGYPAAGWPLPAPDAAAGPGPLPGDAERVGYDPPDARPGGYDALTGAGPQRRDQGRPQAGPVTGEERPGQEQGGQDHTAEGRSTNDELWQRAEQAREPKAGGVTLSGLPRRVPRANLVPGAAQPTPQTGPLVSRAPEDVRGRLSNLRRGIQQGHGAPDAVPDGYSSPTDSQGSGPNHQER